jgi:signal transduction histidine kinase
MSPEPRSQPARPAFDISPQVVFRLGDELITDELQALVELVKNSYDASATWASVVIDTQAPTDGVMVPHGLSSMLPASARTADSTSAKGKATAAVGWLEVRDDGDGMTREGLEAGWLLISSSAKRSLKEQGKTNRLGRTPLGDKGLGRLGVLRLGLKIEIRTRPREAAEEHILRFSRSDFENETALSAIDLHYETRTLVKHGEAWQPQKPFAHDVDCTPLTGRQGTVIRITGLINPEVWQDRQAIQERMLSLISPFEEIHNFTLDLTIDRELVPLAQIAELRLDLANARWTLQFDGTRLHIDGRIKLRAFEPASTNERLTNLWRELVAPDNGEQFRSRLLAGPLSGVQGAAGDAPYWLALSFETPLASIPDPSARRRRTARVGAAEDQHNWVSPGPFSGEIDSFDLASDVELSVNNTSIFSSGGDYRDWVRQIRGVRVFRDGFGVRVGDDFLRLGSAFTSASGFYALRPGNVAGYVAISAKDNAGLQETTDREGFVVNSPYRAFDALLRWTVERVNYLQNQIGRALSAWADEAKLPEPPRPSRTATELAQQAAAQARRTSQALGAVETVQRTLQRLGDGSALLTPDQEKATQAASQILTQLSELAAEWQSLQSELSELADRSREVELEREELRDQLRVAYQTVGLGIVAESVAHEMAGITGRLQARTKQLATSLGPKDTAARALVTDVNKAVRDIRQQIRHLEPQLRYQRAKRELLDVRATVEAVAAYHRERFANNKIEVTVTGAPFTVRANSGRLQQALDNLFINSEFWLENAHTPDPQIEIVLEKPRLLLRDNGPGVDPVLAPAIFEPFVSGRSGEQGRGLGLFITRQVLQDDHGTIFLADGDPDGVRRTFVIDLRDAVADES